MLPRTVTLIWLGGILVAAIAYAVDPGALFERLLDLLAATIAAVERFVANLSLFGTEVIRALAVGLFATFVALAVVAIRRGAQGRMALFVVSVMFVLLLRNGGSASNGNWVAAFALAAVAALVMTGRVRRRAP